MQVIASPKVYPVIVIGSGASGGMAAWNLTRQGVEVLLLDAGDKFDRTKFWTHVTPWEARDRRAGGEAPPRFYLDTAIGTRVCRVPLLRQLRGGLRHRVVLHVFGSSFPGVTTQSTSRDGKPGGRN